jgi:uncharacterized protein
VSKPHAADAETMRVFHGQLLAPAAGMRWDQGHESPDVEDRRGRGGGLGGAGLGMLLPIAGRFGIPGVVIFLIIYFIAQGGSCSGAGAPPTSGVTPGGAPAKTADDTLARFVAYVFDDVQSTWTKELAAHNARYVPAHLVLYDRATPSACGTGTAAAGPFYCPLDRKVYIDLSFYRALSQRLGAPGDFAQAYVIAHEVGHHVQNLLGKLPQELGRGSVPVELQADCLSGAWARDAQARDKLDPGDIDEALTAAAAVGDDKLQEQAGQAVRPESFTHGSAAQRSAAFKSGLKGGLDACLTRD